MILDQFKSKLIEFMKNKDSERLEVLRFFLAQVKNKEIELRPQAVELTDEHALKAIKKLLKQCDETIELNQKAGRSEGVKKAEREKEILLEFMTAFPEALRSSLESPQFKK